jgi:PAS domain S-box-containing protein
VLARRLAEAQRLAHLGSWEWEIEANTVSVSDEMYRILGVEPEAFPWTFETSFALVHPDDRERVRAVIGQALASGEPVDYEARVLRPDGSERVLHTRGELVLGDHGTPVRMFGTALDVTERVRAEEALAKSEERLRSLLEGVTVGVYRSTPDGTIMEANPALAHIMGYEDVDSLLAADAHDLYPDPAEREVWREAVEREGVLRDYEMPHVRPDGSVMWVRETARAVRNEDGAVESYEGILEDITEAKRAEEAEQKSNQALRALVEASPVPIVALDLEGNVALWNPAAERIFGWSADEVLGHPYPLVANQADFERARQTVTAGETVDRLEAVRLRKDGSSIAVEISAAPLLDAHGGCIGSVGVVSDISERKHAEEKLHDSFGLLRRTDEQRRRLLSKLVTAQEEERRRIAGDIHDDSLQAITAGLMRLHGLARRLSSPSDLEALRTLETTLQHSVARLRHLLFELRPPALDRDGLAATLRMHLQAVREETRLDYRLEYGLDTRPTGEIEVTLFRIALEAVANVRKHSRAALVTVSLEASDDGVLMRVTDDGEGFAPDDEEAARGHLGLASMRERAELAGGWCRVRSRPGSGTTVEAWVPAGTKEGATR